APTTVGGARVSPLAAEAYKLLEREGALTTMELRTRLGREVTEAAVLRSLAELWHTMRVVPVPAENAPEGAHWELLIARHRRELNIGSTQSQTTALSILVSFYLQSAVAATAEEVEIFLSPVASRSRIRDVVRGLSTTRQLASFSLAGDEQFYVEGTLPEIAEEEIAEEAPIAAGAIGEDAGLEQNQPSLIEAAAANPDAIPRQRSSSPRRTARPAFGERARGSFAARDRGGPSSDRRGPSPDRSPRREGGFRRPQRSGSSERGSFRRAEGADGTSRPPRPNFERRARPSFAPSADKSERPSRPDSSDRPKRFERSDRPVRFDRAAAGASRGGGFDKRSSFAKGRPPRPGGSSFRPKKSFPGKPFSGKPFGGRPARSDQGTDRPRFRPAAGAGSPRFGKDRPARPPRDGERPQRSFGDGHGASRPAGGPRRFEGRPGGSGRTSGFSRPRRDGESRPAFRGGEARPQGDRPFKRPYAPSGARLPRREPAGGFGKPGGDRPERKFPPRPRPAAGRSEHRSEAGERPVRPGGFSKPAGRPGSFGKPSFRKPAFGKPGSGKPGGYRKPAGDRPATADQGADRPRPPRPASRPAFGAGPRKPGGFRKPGAPGKSFGKPRPAGAGKGRTSTTTSSGKPRRPGGFGKAGPGASSGRPPARGSFGDFKPRGKSSGAKRPAAKRPGGLGAPKRKPRSEGDEG
ncbi:MAG TPA: hypothetical protein VFE06_06760, partial [Acidobacteriaceae bacterium]|nr:hypothetical protein [Acidobacteriaceae bacterium]